MMRYLWTIKENSLFRLRKNKELFTFYEDLSISQFKRIQTIRWLGNVIRMNEEMMDRRLYYGTP